MEREPRFTPGPYSTDAFNEVFAGRPDYGAMILGADGETIVAQCVAERDVPLLMKAPELYAALERATELIEGAEKDTNWISTAWHEDSAAVEFRALLSKARGDPSAEPPQIERMER